MLFSVNWWPWLEQLREEAHSGRDWLADEYWIATCLRKYWIATALRLRKGPAEQGRKFKTWGKVSWLWAITRRKIQIYGKLALAGEKASALPSSGSGVSHWKRFLSALLYGRIFMWNHLWQQLRKNLQHSANTVGVKCDNSSSQICHFQILPVHRISSVILNLAIFNTIFNSHHYSLLCLSNNIYTDLYLYRGVAWKYWTNFHSCTQYYRTQPPLWGPSGADGG